MVSQTCLEHRFPALMPIRIADWCGLCLVSGLVGLLIHFGSLPFQRTQISVGLPKPKGHFMSSFFFQGKEIFTVINNDKHMKFRVKKFDRTKMVSDFQLWQSGFLSAFEQNRARLELQYRYYFIVRRFYHVFAHLNHLCFCSYLNPTNLR